ncbi:Target recognition domain of lytic exoenzyme, partial [Pilibacter termitis]
AKPIDKVLIGKNVEVMKEQVKVYSWSKKEYLVKLNGKELGWLLEQDTWGQLPSKIPVTKDKRKVYRIDDLQFVNGVWQVRCNDLAPAGFDWTDNGIPVDYITKINADGTNLASNGTEVKKGDCFVFDYGQLSDTNYGVYDSGWYWRQFGTARHGRIWLSAWNGNHLYYG